MVRRVCDLCLTRPYGEGRGTAEIAVCREAQVAPVETPGATQVRVFRIEPTEEPRTGDPVQYT